MNDFKDSLYRKVILYTNLILILILLFYLIYDAQKNIKTFKLIYSSSKRIPDFDVYIYLLGVLLLLPMLFYICKKYKYSQISILIISVLNVTLSAKYIFFPREFHPEAKIMFVSFFYWYDLLVCAVMSGVVIFLNILLLRKKIEY